MTMPMIFVKLPVQDVSAAREFYGALGFGVNEAFSDERTVSVVIDDNIVVQLITRELFAQYVPAEVGNPAQVTTVVTALTANSRAEVDELVAKAGAGGKVGPAAETDGGWTYQRTFTDPDGHVWEVVFLEQHHVVN
jgi:predicted lactoylglutathione lyase